MRPTRLQLWSSRGTCRASVADRRSGDRGARSRPRAGAFEATLVRALSTPIVPRLARYDVIIVSDSSDDERETRIAAEFARHEHRVFHLGEHSARRPPAAPTLHRIAAPPASRADRPGLLYTLASLRQSEAIETAVLFAPQRSTPK